MGGMIGSGFRADKMNGPVTVGASVEAQSDDGRFVWKILKFG